MAHGQLVAHLFELPQVGIELLLGLQLLFEDAAMILLVQELLFLGEEADALVREWAILVLGLRWKWMASFVSCVHEESLGDVLTIFLEFVRVLFVVLRTRHSRHCLLPFYRSVDYCNWVEVALEVETRQATCDS